MEPNATNPKERNDARKVLEVEANSILRASNRLGKNFSEAVDLLFKDKGKIIVTGIGKSGHLGKKLAATFCSTGSPAAFLHPPEAVHGDLGIHQKGDPVIFLSNSGATPELLALEPVFRQRTARILGILGKEESPLREKVDVFLDASVSHEADPLNIVPTASFTVAASLGDALSSALMRRRNFSEKDYAMTHPAGQLGRNLILSVANVMHKPEKVAFVEPSTPLKDIVIQMTENPLGASCVIKNSKLVGIITDGDLRRSLKEVDDLNDLIAEEIMCKSPQTVQPNTSLGEALEIMEGGKSPISVVPVIDDKEKRIMGLIRLHDIFTTQSN